MSAAIATRQVSPGAVVLRELGRSEIAAACGLDPSAVWRWGQDAPKGTGGIVPAVHHVTLLRLARQLGRNLTADDLVLGRTE